MFYLDHHITAWNPPYGELQSRFLHHLQDDMPLLDVRWYNWLRLMQTDPSRFRTEMT